MLAFPLPRRVGAPSYRRSWIRPCRQRAKEFRLVTDAAVSLDTMCRFFIPRKEQFRLRLMFKNFMNLITIVVSSKIYCNYSEVWCLFDVLVRSIWDQCEECNDISSPIRGVKLYFHNTTWIQEKTWCPKAENLSVTTKDFALSLSKIIALLLITMYYGFFFWDISTATLSRGLLGHDIVAKTAIW